jgi:hypothetical protein
MNPLLEQILVLFLVLAAGLYLLWHHRKKKGKLRLGLRLYDGKKK